MVVLDEEVLKGTSSSKEKIAEREEDRTF